MIPTMKTVFTFAALLFSMVTVSALDNFQPFETHEISDRFYDDPGIKACCYESTPSSKYGEEDVVAGTMMLLQSMSFKEPLFVHVEEELILVSNKTIDITNMHFVVHRGGTLTFRAPALKIAREQASVFPVFEVTGSVNFEATGSAPVLLDGNLVDEGGVVLMTKNATFMSAPGNIVRYHASGMTVTTMGHDENLDVHLHEAVELRPELKASLASVHAKLNAKRHTPDDSTAAADRKKPAGRSQDKHDDPVEGIAEHNQNASEATDTDAPEGATAGDRDFDGRKKTKADDTDADADQTPPATAPHEQPASKEGSDQSAAANQDDGDGEDVTECKRDHGNNTAGRDQAASATSATDVPGVDGSKNSDADIDPNGPATGPPGPTAGKDPDGLLAPNQGSYDRNKKYTSQASQAAAPPATPPPHEAPYNHTLAILEFLELEAAHAENTTRSGGDPGRDDRGPYDRYSPLTKHKYVLKVGDKLTKVLLAADNKSMVLPSRRGSIIFGRVQSNNPSAASETDEPGKSSSDSGKGQPGTDEEPGRSSSDSGKGQPGSIDVRASVLVAADTTELNAVLEARAAVLKERREEKRLAEAREQGLVEEEVVEGVWAKQSKAWGWVTRPIGYDKLVERAREHLGEVDMTIDNRGCVEVTVDGTCVLSKSGRFSPDWINRFPWRRREDEGYTLEVESDVMEVRLGQKRIWGVKVADNAEIIN